MKVQKKVRKTIRDFGAIIPAAGYSSRMKAFKPLLPVGETTALETLLSAVKAAGIENIAVVSGYSRERIAPVIKKAGAVEAYNADYDDGMFSSIQTGLRYVRDNFAQMSGFFLMPVDCPLISSSVLKQLIEAASAELTSAELDFAEPTSVELTSAEPVDAVDTADTADTAKTTDAVDTVDIADTADTGNTFIQNFYVPVFEGKKGHPLLIPAVYGNEICSYSGSGGLKAITDKYWDRIIRVPVEDEGCLLDMDTPEGYEEILAFRNAGGRREDLRTLAAGRRIFLIRHGETRQHREKMFIGRYDVPLEETARSRVEAMARKLADILTDTPALKSGEAAGNSGSDGSDGGVLYTSPLQRAEQTAEIIRTVLMEASNGVKHANGIKHEDERTRPPNEENRPASEEEWLENEDEQLANGKARSANEDERFASDENRPTNEDERPANEDERFASDENRPTNEGKSGFAWTIRQVVDLQEIALGDWDGKTIREIRGNYPDEYQRRGADLFAFKIGNKAENFYDVQYRAVKALRKILKEDTSRDIILVTHSAVIRALENNLKGLRVDDSWETLSKNDFRMIEL